MVYAQDMETINGSISLGVYATVFQAEIHAISALAQELSKRGTADSTINIFTDSQAALKAISGESVMARTVLNCRETISILERNNNTIKILWVPGHSNVEGNERADELAKLGAERPMMGAEPALPIPRCTVKRAIWENSKKRHEQRWRECNTGRFTKSLVPSPNARLTTALLALKRREVRLLCRVLCCQNDLKSHLYRIGRAPDPLCRFCMEEEETTVHVIEKCPILVPKRQRILGSPDISLRELIEDVDIKSILKFITELEIF